MVQGRIDTPLLTGSYDIAVCVFTPAIVLGFLAL